MDRLSTSLFETNYRGNLIRRRIFPPKIKSLVVVELSYFFDTMSTQEGR